MHYQWLVTGGALLMLILSSNEEVSEVYTAFTIRV
jgi:hypothetical protein